MVPKYSKFPKIDSMKRNTSNASLSMRSGKFRVLILILLVFLVYQTTIKAQIYEPDGLRMPGDWNAWTNTTGMGGVFDLQKIQSGTPHGSTPIAKRISELAAWLSGR